MTRRDLKTGKIDVLADKYNGFPFAAPNDLCVRGIATSSPSLCASAVETPNVNSTTLLTDWLGIMKKPDTATAATINSNLALRNIGERQPVVSTRAS